MSTAKKLQNKLFRAGRESSSSFPISDSPSGPHPQSRRVQATVFSTQSQELTRAVLQKNSLPLAPQLEM